jgi:hypothetical protein
LLPAPPAAPRLGDSGGRISRSAGFGGDLSRNSVERFSVIDFDAGGSQLCFKGKQRVAGLGDFLCAIPTGT